MKNITRWMAVTAILAGTSAFAPAQAQPSGVETGQSLRAMTFRVVGSGPSRVILAQGDIMPGSAAAFEGLVRRGHRGVPVVISSPGGSLLGGMQLGFAFRRAGAPVIVGRGRGMPGVCASACVHAFAGGVVREVPPGAAIGVHESFRASVRGGRVVGLVSPVSDDQTRRARMLELEGIYFRSMGVDPALVSAGVGVPPSRLRQLSPAEMAAWRLTTRGTRRAGADSEGSMALDMTGAGTSQVSTDWRDLSN